MPYLSYDFIDVRGKVEVMWQANLQFTGYELDRHTLLVLAVAKDELGSLSNSLLALVVLVVIVQEEAFLGFYEPLGSAVGGKGLSLGSIALKLGSYDVRKWNLDLPSVGARLVFLWSQVVQS